MVATWSWDTFRDTIAVYSARRVMGTVANWGNGRFEVDFRLFIFFVAEIEGVITPNF